MTATTMLEKEIVLKIFKDITVDYNPSSISKEVHKTREGSFKALKYLEEDAIVKGKNFGKARFYHINLDDEYARKNVELLLLEEAKPYQRWKDEFLDFIGFVDVIVMFGSFIRNPKGARDIDLLLIFKQKENHLVNENIKLKNSILMKKIHPIKQTEQEFKKNLRKGDKVLVNAVKEGIVLYGYAKYVELIRDVKSRQ